MSYWILAVLVASGIVVFEGTVAWWIVPLFIVALAWERGQEAWKRVVGVLLCVVVGAAFVFVCTRSDTTCFYGR